MSSDKFSAVWVSHTSICDFLQCPRSYYLKHVYKDPVTNHKIKLMSPPLALGQSVHEVIESLSILPVDQRFNIPLVTKFEETWKKVKGLKGGFANNDVEQRYKLRGEEMLKRVTAHPGPIAKQAVKIKMDLPNYWLSEEENIILCGKIDWLEYLPITNGVHIIDFKTGKSDEGKDSLQLPIYLLLVTNCQSRKVEKASYWYLDREDDLTECSLPDYKDAHKNVLDIARKIKVARALEKYNCPTQGCMYCKPYEAILRGEAELAGVDEYNANVYVLKNDTELAESIVL